MRGIIVLNATEYLQQALGGNMNTCSLKPEAIIELMDEYHEYRIVLEKINDHNK